MALPGETFSRRRSLTDQADAENTCLSQDTIGLGLGEATEVDQLLVRWPDGRKQIVEVDGIDRTLTVKRPIE